MLQRSDMTPKEIENLLRPYIPPHTIIPGDLYTQLAKYLELLLKWNARTNLTAIRHPEEIVRRHFGESLFAAQHLPECRTLLDFGSGAGFPGLPIQLSHPDLHVTLAESQNKKATFLSEVVRTLDLNTNVWPARVEAMPVGLQFDVVTLRAVDNMDAAIAAASVRVVKRMIVLAGHKQAGPDLPGFQARPGIAIPGADPQQLLCLDRSSGGRI